MTEIKKPQVPFTTAGAFIIANCMLQLVQYGLLKTGVLGGINVAYTWQDLVFWLLNITLAIFVSIRKFPVVNMICIGFIVIANIVGVISSLSTPAALIVPTYQALIDLVILFLFDGYGTFSLLLLFLMSVGALTQKGFTGVGRIWVFAMLLRIFATVIHSITLFVGVFAYGMSAPNAIINFCILVIYCIGFCLLCKWYGKTLSARRAANMPAPKQYTRQAPVIDTMVYASPTYATPAQSAEEQNIDSLKKYKDLLDDGVITQEEFDAKKKQLLGL